MNPSQIIIEAALKLAGRLPGDLVEQAAQIVSSHEAIDARSRVADSIPNPHYRSLLLSFFQEWVTKAASVSPAEVAIALRSAGWSQWSRDAERSVEIVWTGPRTDVISCRHTEHHRRGSPSKDRTTVHDINQRRRICPDLIDRSDRL